MLYQKMHRTPSVKTTKTVLTKFAKSVPVSNNNIKGTFTITNYRRYNYYEEIDVNFQGSIFVYHNGKKTWFTPKELGKNVSKIKLNRFLRKSLYKELETYLRYFSVKIKYYNWIKKIEWI